MANYGNLNINKRKKGRKIMVAAIVLVVILAAALMFIGIVAGSDGEKMEYVSSVVEENTRLKMQISELNDTITKMQTTIDDLNAQLAARPTPIPTPPAAPDTVIPTEPPQGNISPRGSLRQ